MVVAVLLLGALVILPRFARSRVTEPRIYCTNNLKQIGVAFMTWALDNTNLPMRVSIANGGTIEWVNEPVFVQFLIISNELSTPRVLVCPEDPTAQLKDRRVSSGWDALTSGLRVSYFVNVDADQNNAQTVLSGDDHLLVNSQPINPGIRSLLPTDKLGWSKPRHDGAGNLLLLDGSVQQINSPALAGAFQPTLLMGNRLAFP